MLGLKEPPPGAPSQAGGRLDAGRKRLGGLLLLLLPLPGPMARPCKAPNPGGGTTASDGGGGHTGGMAAAGGPGTPTSAGGLLLCIHWASSTTPLLVCCACSGTAWQCCCCCHAGGVGSASAVAELAPLPWRCRGGMPCRAPPPAQLGGGACHGAAGVPQLEVMRGQLPLRAIRGDSKCSPWGPPDRTTAAGGAMVLGAPHNMEGLAISSQGAE
jgi:hypothetical protein